MGNIKKSEKDAKNLLTIGAKAGILTKLSARAAAELKRGS
jgi:hypothetical protein